MATRAMAQDVIICDMCETSPVQMHCNACETNLCNGCLSKHVTADTKTDHDLVIYKKKNTKPIFPLCKTHKEENCQMKCKQCNIPVCVKCVTSKSHKKHEFIDMLHLCDSLKRDIKQKTTELETLTYPKYEKAVSELEIQLQNLPESYDRLMSEVDSQGEQWHREVDIIIDRQKQEVKKMKIDDLATLKKLQEEMKNLLSTLRQAIMENNDILQSADVTKVLDSKHTSPEMWDPPPNIDVTPPTFTQLPIQGEQLTEMFGTLIAASVPCKLSSIKLGEDKLATAVKQLQLLDSPEFPSSIDTKYEYQFCITCLSPDEVWVSGDSSQIKHFTVIGSLQETVTTTTGNKPNGITVSTQGDLIFTDGHYINRVRQGKIEKIISLQQGWTARAVCCTDSDQLLITMKKIKTPSRVVCCSGSTEKQVIQFDDQGKPLFSSGSILVIAQNSNKDMICVLDWGTDTVVVLNQAGKLCFRYPGNFTSQRYKSFKPFGVAIDIMEHILVADFINNCIHIIDQQGHFIHYYLPFIYDCYV